MSKLTFHSQITVTLPPYCGKEIYEQGRLTCSSLISVAGRIPSLWLTIHLHTMGGRSYGILSSPSRSVACNTILQVKVVRVSTNKTMDELAKK